MQADSVDPNRSLARRRGRPAAGTQQQRRDRVLDAALEELVATGADGLTMAAVAARAGSSKETLYRWFGDRDGLFTALIQRNADRSSARIDQRLEEGNANLTAESFRETLVAYAAGLLELLTSDASVALNRAAMNDSNLRTLLLQQGRHRVGPIVERYLENGDRAGWIAIERVGGSEQAFELLYGLIVRDTQIRVLLGERRPTGRFVSERAEAAVAQFIRLAAIKR